LKIGINRDGLEVEIKNYDTKISHYIGIITHTSNTNIGQALIELDQFSVDLVNENLGK